MHINAERFRNEETGKLLTVAPDGLLRQFSDTGSPRQLFVRQGGGTDPIDSVAFSPNRVIDARGGAIASNTLLQIYPAHGGANQNWQVKNEGPSGSGPLGYEVFSFRANGTDFVWDIPYGDPAEGNYVQLFEHHGNNNQLWDIVPRPIDAVVIKSLHSNFALDVPGFADGLAYIQHYTVNGGYNQAWVLEGDLDSTVRIKSVSSGRFLTSSFVTTANDALVFQSRSSNRDTQFWRFDLDDNNRGTIRNEDNGFFLSVPPGPVTGATLVACRPGPGTADDQRWKVDF